MPDINDMIKITKVEALPHQHVRLTFDDGAVKIIDIGALVKGSMFEADFRKPEFFRAVKKYAYGRGIYWPNEFDLCPDSLRYHMKGEIVKKGDLQLS
jgi:hypothetical protein